MALSLHASSATQLPFWLLLVKMFWSDMLAYWRRGRTLAISLVNQLSKVGRAITSTEVQADFRIGAFEGRSCSKDAALTTATECSSFHYAGASSMFLYPKSLGRI